MYNSMSPEHWDKDVHDYLATLTPERRKFTLALWEEQRHNAEVEHAKLQRAAREQEELREELMSITSEKELLQRIPLAVGHRDDPYKWLLQHPAATAMSYDFVAEHMKYGPGGMHHYISPASTLLVKLRFLEKQRDRAISWLMRDFDVVPEEMAREASLTSVGMASQYIRIHGYHESLRESWLKLILAQAPRYGMEGSDVQSLLSLLCKHTEDMAFVVEYGGLLHNCSDTPVLSEKLPVELLAAFMPSSPAVLKRLIEEQHRYPERTVAFARALLELAPLPLTARELDPVNHGPKSRWRHSSHAEELPQQYAIEEHLHALVDVAAEPGLRFRVNGRSRRVPEGFAAHQEASYQALSAR